MTDVLIRDVPEDVVPPSRPRPSVSVCRGPSTAVEVQQLLADRGHHRAPAVPDLLIAATAELAGLAVLHLDKDFDLIADVTGQEVQRLALDE